MTEPCTQGPTLERIEKKFDRFDMKLDRIQEQLVSAAVLAESHRGLSIKVEDIDERLKDVEGTPKKTLMAVTINAISAAIGAVIVLIFSQWGSS